MNELWKKAKKVPKRIGTKAYSYSAGFRPRTRSYSLGTVKISSQPSTGSKSSGDGSTAVYRGVTLPHSSSTGGRRWTFSMRLRLPPKIVAESQGSDPIPSSSSKATLPLPVSSRP